MESGRERPAARLLPFGMHDATWNMAVDEALLACATVPTLRLYGWRPPAISLGRFQGRREDIAPLLAAGLPVVRRITGGGAIVHWHEVTYSLVLPEDHPLIAGRQITESYAAIHAPVQVALLSLGVAASARPVMPQGGPDPLLCFERTTALDLVAAGAKLVGSAQRRTRGRVLQHGSLILAPNPFQPATASLEALLGQRPEARVVAQALATAFEEALGGLIPGDLGPAEAEHARKAAPRYRFA